MRPKVSSNASMGGVAVTPWRASASLSAAEDRVRAGSRIAPRRSRKAVARSESVPLSESAATRRSTWLSSIV